VSISRGADHRTGAIDHIPICGKHPLPPFFIAQVEQPCLKVADLLQHPTMGEEIGTDRTMEVKDGSKVLSKRTTSTLHFLTAGLFIRKLL